MVHAMHPSEIGTGGQVIRTEMMQRLLPAGGFRNVQVLQIELAPGAEAPHHRDDVAILAYVLEGIVESEPEEGKVSTHNRGDAWWQSPGPHVHLIARKSSKTRRARLLTVLIEKDASAVR
jgi:quercetin dioxygenase-like cupin family protein